MKVHGHSIKSYKAQEWFYKMDKAFVGPGFFRYDNATGFISIYFWKIFQLLLKENNFIQLH